jgi:hypothetical protein
MRHQLFESRSNHSTGTFSSKVSSGDQLEVICNNEGDHSGQQCQPYLLLELRILTHAAQFGHSKFRILYRSATSLHLG